MLLETRVLAKAKFTIPLEPGSEPWSNRRALLRDEAGEEGHVSQEGDADSGEGGESERLSTIDPAVWQSILKFSNAPIRDSRVDQMQESELPPRLDVV